METTKLSLIEILRALRQPRPGIRSTGPGRTFTRRIPAGLSYCEPQPGFYMVGPSRALRRRTPVTGHSVSPSCGGSSGGPHSRPSYGGPKPDLHTACHSRTFKRMDHRRILDGVPPSATLPYGGDDQAPTNRAQLGFQMAGPIRAFVRQIPASPSYSGPQSDFQTEGGPRSKLYVDGTGGPRPGFHSVYPAGPSLGRP